MKTIKRYSNRLLYDSSSSCFITSKELREMVRRGADFSIVQNHSGEDVTIPVLSQILIEDLNQNKNKESVIDTLRGFIALGGDFSMDILKKTILASIGVFEITKAKAEEIVDTLIKQGEIAKSKRSEAVLELLEKAEESGRSFKEKVVTDVEKTINNMKFARKKDLDELSSKFDELADQVKAVITKLGAKES